MRNDHPAITAASAGDLPQLAELLTTEPAAVNARGWMGITPLIAAAWQADSPDVVRFLLAHGADPTAVRTNGDGALHWAASGPVAELLAAADPTTLDARYLFDQTPLHVAVAKGHRDVVRAFLAAGADTAARDKHGDTPLDLAAEPTIARLLVEAGAALRTARPTTPLHAASLRSARDRTWVPVVELMLTRGADPGLRDEFGALPADLTGAGPAAPLGLDEVAVGAQSRVTIHPTRPEALTTMYSGTVLVRWRLTPDIAPVEVIRVGGRKPVWGPYSDGPTLAFASRDSVWLRDWTDLRAAREIPEEWHPEDMAPTPVVSADGRYLVLPEAEGLRAVDLARGEIAGHEYGFGDWSVEPRFSPDGRTVAVGNSMQGSWWVTVLAIDGQLTRRYAREAGLPTTNGPEIVTDLAFTADGGRFATWVRPDHGRTNNYRGLVATTWTESGEPAWHRHVEAPGGPASAALCFTPDGTRLAVGLDSGILWLDAETGEPTGHDTTGAVNALASHRAVGMIAATPRGLRRVEPR